LLDLGFAPQPRLLESCTPLPLTSCPAQPLHLQVLHAW
jgi:hypothetical protein